MQEPIELPRHFHAEILNHCLDLSKIAADYKFNLTSGFNREFRGRIARFLTEILVR